MGEGETARDVSAQDRFVLHWLSTRAGLNGVGLKGAGLKGAGLKGAIPDGDAPGGFSDPLSDPLSEAVAIRSETSLAAVEEAVGAGRVALAYQPVVQGRRPDLIAFQEGFIRLLTPGGRLIPARDFIHRVEESELGRKIDCLALEMGLHELEAEPGLRLSVNLSARSIGYPAWQRLLQRGLSRDPTVAERLVLELSEASVMQLPDLVGAFMREVQPRGLCFALDDFGAGITSLRHLRDFDFDLVKIDGGLIRDVAVTPDNRALVRALQAVAREFGMFTVAEAVECGADADWLRAKDIDCLQGYFYGAPTLHPAWRKVQPHPAAGSGGTPGGSLMGA